MSNPADITASLQKIPIPQVKASLKKITEFQARKQKDRLNRASVDLQVIEAHLVARFTRIAHQRAKPNIFKVLGLETREDTVSRIVGWLSDPKGSHGLGASFLLDFLTQLTQVTGIYEDRKVLAKIIHDPHIWSYEVYREFSRGSARLDLLINGSEGRIVIETKLNAHEHSNQTVKYSKLFSGGVPTIFVYLAPDDATKPSSTDFLWCRYSRLLTLITDTQGKYRLESSTDSLLGQFVDVISQWSQYE